MACFAIIKMIKRKNALTPHPVSPLIHSSEADHKHRVSARESTDLELSTEKIIF